ncbi:MAG: hypothetical protein A3B16_01165 [Candidatus Zambryskibacteria bacterium RIFCSPLOWO2_01_FULL_45_43]|uniref:AttH domain-containing protein n=2 Tax=Parcubacteria group TaxID=1794811 RepID=A0A1G1ZSY2_9BACT|nr:MAG: hypothetical protein A3H63_03055 [Candidatus Harrisonbacteria bacterium RIFCSPLOWO2_02_FULL_45_10c]OHB05771.1 MAG: hypothetical protein A3B16_01165 [Candidatus Zambryskibacteria bacterium RIFCSPLOWO2_01_FULL_45_43]
MNAPLSFPRDESAHESVIEWWYFNGNLRSADNRDFAFMYCLFKADPQKVKLPFFDKMPVKNFYFSHFLISDIAGKRYNSGVRFFYEGIDKESFSKPLLFIKEKETLLLEENPESEYQLQTGDLNLKLSSKKNPLLVNGSGWIDLGTKSTYYYSLTHLETSGAIRFNGREISVQGLSWMDHQWADTYYSSEDTWTWFSIQLSDGIEILCFEYGKTRKTLLASRIDSGGAQATTRRVILEPLKKTWVSPKTQAVYQVEWRIELPDWELVMAVKAKIADQEVLFGSINYWEGAVEVSGTRAGKEISGQGFLEMVGVPMKKKLSELYLEEAKEMVSDYLAKYGYRP